MCKIQGDAAIDLLAKCFTGNQLRVIHAFTHILSPESCKRCLRVQCWRAKAMEEKASKRKAKMKKSIKTQAAAGENWKTDCS